MKKFSKRLKDAYSSIKKEETYNIDAALDHIINAPKTKFDETVELHLHLNIDPKNSEQIVRGTVSLPHGTGKKIRIAAFCRGEMEAKAKEAGARIATELVVSGAFHSPLMLEAQDGLAKALNEIEFKDATIPVYTNVTGKPVPFS